MQSLLEIKDLSVTLDTPRGEFQVLRQLWLTLAEGEILALVGASGCGKTLLLRSILGLLPPNARCSGSVSLEGLELTACGERALCRVRGSRVSMVFQNPMTALNPTRSAEDQIAEAVRLHHPGLPRREVCRRVGELLDLVGVPRPETRRGRNPHQLSGGTCQRMTLAMALAGEPRLLLADEPTTALDVTAQARILELLRTLRQKTRIAVLLVTHDLGVAARTADRVAVMREGRIVETGAAEHIFEKPAHPYTREFLGRCPL